MASSFLPTFLLLLALPGLRAAVTLLESGGDLRPPGGSVTLVCRGSGFNFGSFDMMWIRQRPGQPLEWIAGINTDSSGTYYAPTFEGRATISRDNGQRSVTLTISSLTDGDSASYFCGKSAYSGYGNEAYSTDAWGKGTIVTVSSEPAHSPAIFPLVSCSPCTSQVTFGCFASQFFPLPAHVAWVGVASGDGNPLTFPAVQSAAGAFGLSSRVTVGVAEAEGRSFRCAVEHRGQNFSYDVTEFCAKPRPDFSISLFANANQSENAQLPEVSLLCQLRGRGVANASVTWYVNDVIAELPQEVIGCEEGSGRGQLSSRVNASKALWEGGATFSCRAEHPRLEQPMEAKISTYCSGPTPSPTLHLLPPSLSTLYLSPSPNLTCVADNLRSAQPPKFSWGRFGAKTVEFEVGEAEELPNGRFRVSSFLRICADEWNSGETFWCAAELEGSGEELRRSVRKDTALPAIPPRVAILPPPAEELARQEVLTLTCLASGFFPADILITWTVQDVPASPGAFSVFGPREDPEGSGRFSAYSKMAAEAERWRRGDVFACVVGHDGIGGHVGSGEERVTSGGHLRSGGHLESGGVGVKFLQRSLDRSAVRPANVNVSVVLADADLVCY